MTDEVEHLLYTLTWDKSPEQERIIRATYQDDLRQRGIDSDV